LADSNGIEQLRFRQPMPTLNEICANKSEQNIATSIEHRANFEEEEKQEAKTKRSCRRSEARLQQYNQRRR
jgi:hypothetical protein